MKKYKVGVRKFLVRLYTLSMLPLGITLYIFLALLHIANAKTLFPIQLTDALIESPGLTGNLLMSNGVDWSDKERALMLENRYSFAYAAVFCVALAKIRA